MPPASSSTTAATVATTVISRTATADVSRDPPTAPPPTCPDAVSTTNPLGRLKSAMKNVGYTQMNAFFDAFLVFFSDEHLSEEPAPEERRLEYISGWDGAGTAAVLADSGGAAMWVPGNDVKRARTQLSCAWLVIDADDPSQPTIAEWISDMQEKSVGTSEPEGLPTVSAPTQAQPSSSIEHSEVHAYENPHPSAPPSKPPPKQYVLRNRPMERLGRNGRIGGDARLTSVVEWQTLSSALQREGLQLIHIPTLIDQLWSEEIDIKRRRPEPSRIVANLHNHQYTGMTWREKVAVVRNELRAIRADAMIITALDEVAWLLNVRGRDVPLAPLLKAFVIVTSRDVKVYAPPGKLSMPVLEVLAGYNCFTNNCTRVFDYTTVYADLRRITESKILIPAGGTFQRGASAAIFQSVPNAKRLFQLSPIIYLKAQKNNAEIKGMKKAHLRDAVAMCTLLSYMEDMVKSKLDEITVATKTDVTRATQAGYVGLSMKTRVAFGPNGADPDYQPTITLNRRIFSNSTLIIQSGGQYDEGTTVVTRTVHFGTPSLNEKRAYTTVLRALAALATLQTPTTLPAAHADPVARAPLWTVKQDYPHPTGHGVGAALNRREDPVVIDYRQDTNLHTFREGYFVTSDPAWYETNGKFGVRLGNVLEVIAKPNGYLGFSEATLLPYESKLIDRNMLTDYEINWLNNYNERIRTTVGPELKDQGLMFVYYWMMNKTIHIEPPSKAKHFRSSSAESKRHAQELACIVISIILAITN